MKYKLTFALVAALTSTAFAELQAPLPEFKNEKQLAEWRAEKESEATGHACNAEDTAFYTGKPYLDSSGDYAFKYRNYDPELARWLSEDPSGFPDGANNKLYVNNMTTDSIDCFGLNIYQITDENAVSGAGHTALITGSGTSYQLQSFGQGSWSSGNGGVTTQYFSSLAAALNSAANQGYDVYNQWDSDGEQDSSARSAFTEQANKGYSASGNNCADVVTAALAASGVDYDATGVRLPNKNHGLNASVASSTGQIPQAHE